jgi:hypothetical protein
MQTKVFEPMKKKVVNLQVMGSSAVLTGEVVYVGEDYLLLSTKKSCRQHVDADKVVSVWMEDDKPVEENTQ